jgi:hypothetical protein
VLGWLDELTVTFGLSDMLVAPATVTSLKVTVPASLVPAPTMLPALAVLLDGAPPEWDLLAQPASIPARQPVTAIAVARSRILRVTSISPQVGGNASGPA